MVERRWKSIKEGEAERNGVELDQYGHQRLPQLPLGIGAYTAKTRETSFLALVDSGCSVKYVPYPLFCSGN